jgi:hypothetical protein
VDSNELINAIYKNAETVRVQVRVSTELYEKLQYLNDQNRIAFNSLQYIDVFHSIIMQAKRLAVFGFGSAKLKEQEAKRVGSQNV